MDDQGPAEAPIPSKCLQKWQEKPKLAVAQQSNQILPITGWEGEGEYLVPEIQNSRLRNGNPDRRVPGPPGWGLGARPATQPRKKKQLAKQSQPSIAGQNNGHQPKRAKWNTDLWLNIGTWNVMTMLKPGKMKEIAEQMLPTRLQIIALQEIRWKGHGQIKKNT